MDGAALRARFDAERDVARAHVTATFTRAEKLQPLDHYLPRERASSASGTMLDRLKQIAVDTEHLS